MQISELVVRKGITGTLSSSSEITKLKSIFPCQVVQAKRQVMQCIDMRGGCRDMSFYFELTVYTYNTGSRSSQSLAINYAAL